MHLSPAFVLIFSTVFLATVQACPGCIFSKAQKKVRSPHESSRQSVQSYTDQTVQDPFARGGLHHQPPRPEERSSSADLSPYNETDDKFVLLEDALRSGRLGGSSRDYRRAQMDAEWEEQAFHNDHHGLNGQDSESSSGRSFNSANFSPDQDDQVGLRDTDHQSYHDYHSHPMSHHVESALDNWTRSLLSSHRVKEDLVHGLHSISEGEEHPSDIETEQSFRKTGSFRGGSSNEMHHRDGVDEVHENYLIPGMLRSRVRSYSSHGKDKDVAGPSRVQ